MFRISLTRFGWDRLMILGSFVEYSLAFQNMPPAQKCCPLGVAASLGAQPKTPRKGLLARKGPDQGTSQAPVLLVNRPQHKKSNDKDEYFAFPYARRGGGMGPWPRSGGGWRVGGGDGLSRREGMRPQPGAARPSRGCPGWRTWADICHKTQAIRVSFWSVTNPACFTQIHLYYESPK